jgi:large subunit ribosomal protein L31
MWPACYRQLAVATIFPDFQIHDSFNEDDAVKQGIHPHYRRATVQCACGNTFETRSTTPAIHVEICAKCHPYYTGKQKLIDTAGRVERFNKKYRPEKAAAS